VRGATSLQADMAILQDLFLDATGATVPFALNSFSGCHDNRKRA